MDRPGTDEAVAPGTALRSSGQGLDPRAFGPTSSLAIAVASTAPAYSFTVVAGTLAISVTTGLPLMLAVAAVPVVLVAGAFRDLNAAAPDCGASYRWARSAFGVSAGWLTGHVVVMADIIVVASLAQVAGTTTARAVGIVDDGSAGFGLARFAVGLGWIAGCALWTSRPVRRTARLHPFLVLTQIGVLVAFVAASVANVGPEVVLQVASSVPPDDGGAWLDAILVGVFLYWGWDTAFSVSEETVRPRVVPGRMVMVAVGVLVAVYVSLAVTAMAVLGAEGIGTAGDNPLVEAARRTAGEPLAAVMGLAVLISAVLSLHATLLPSTRTVLAMGVAGDVPAGLGRIDPRTRVPAPATLACALASAVTFAALTLMGAGLAADLLIALGLLVSCYYAITAFAAVRLLRGVLPAGLGRRVRRLRAGAAGAMFTLVFAALLTQGAVPERSETQLFGVGGVLVIAVSVASAMVGALASRRVRHGSAHGATTSSRT